MGLKFYRGADKPKKIRKRFTQTRSWFRTLKWVACNQSPSHLTKRSRSPYIRGWPSFQGVVGLLNRPTPPP